MKVKSVYNFVPAPKESEVFKPEWADQVSHDIPFSDGESGEIEISITAETPIFIRNGHSKDNESNEFSHYIIDGEKKYFIPATSLKGMFRNVLEITTSSRMSLSEGAKGNSEEVHGMRDMINSQYTADNSQVKSGWLIKDGDNWIIRECKNHRISLRDIEKKFNLASGSLKNIGVEKNKSCVDKINGKRYRFGFVKDLGKWVGKQYTFDDYGDEEGYVVLYGDIDNKRYDYIFLEPSDNVFKVDAKLVKVLDDIEKNSENKKDSLWLYFKNKNWQPGIPVFFVPNQGNKSVKHFGLTKLYRRNNSHYLNELEPFKGYLNSDEKDKLDLAELIFGSVRSESLKGRVYISHAWSDNASPMKQEERILNSPKPSFYPAYLEQQGQGGALEGRYSTYHDSNAELRGFKRYPVHLGIKPNIESDNENLASHFIPLNQGVTFAGKIRYFNLRPQEIGALVSAITFHGNSDKFSHSIGGAKPYGFGKVKVEITNSIQADEYLQSFELEINKHLKDIGKGNFVNNENVKELFSIGSAPKDNKVNKLLTYPSLESEGFSGKGKQTVNEFNKYKEERVFLDKYSERNGTYKVPSKINPEYLRALEEKKLEEERLKKEAEKQQIIDIQRLLESGTIEELEAFLAGEELDKHPTFRIKMMNKLDELRKIKTQQTEQDNIDRKLEEIEARREEYKKRELTVESLRFDNIRKEASSFRDIEDYEFTENQKIQLTDLIEKSWVEDRKSFYKGKKVRGFGKNPWTVIKVWLGNDRAKELFEKLTEE